MEYTFTTENFDAEVLQSETPVLVDFYADWCGPCKMMAPVVAKIADEYAGKLKVGKCDVDDNMQLAQRYRIASIPCMMVFKNGEAAATIIGAMPGSELKARIDQAI